MKRVVKWIKQRKSGKVYKQPWIGYNYRNENGTPDFRREISLKTLDEEQVKMIDYVLRHGGELDDITAEVEFLGAKSIGGFWAAFRIAEQLGIIEELTRFDEKHRFAIMSMILDRIIQPLPHSKQALWEYLPGSPLERIVAPEGMKIQHHDIYKSLETLYAAQDEIQQSLYASRSNVDNMYLYDITSSYFEGTNCPLSEFGYNRDGKKGKMQVVIGLLTDSDGCPIAIEVFSGNTSDQTTVMGKIDQMRERFGIQEMIFIGDRGMVTKARRDDLQDDKYNAVKYISALTRGEFFAFLDDQDHPLQLTLFDQSELVEVSQDGVRYVLSFNPEKEEEDREVRFRLLEKTEEKLKMIERNVKNGRWKNQKVIAKRLYTWLNKWNMERFFDCDYSEGKFSYSRNEDKIKEYESIDGFYVLLSDVDEEMLDTKGLREKYKSLIQVEQAFRTMKTTDLFVRPIRHWKPERVKGHVFMCMLAYMVVWKARSLFSDFISAEEHSTDSTQDDCHSLRIIWERLNQSVQIGTIKINGKKEERLNPVPNEVKKILKAADASLTKKQKNRLKFVG